MSYWIALSGSAGKRKSSEPRRCEIAGRRVAVCVHRTKSACKSDSRGVARMIMRASRDERCDQRRREVSALREMGWKYSEIGFLCGISGDRARSICYKGDWIRHGLAYANLQITGALVK